MTAGQLATSQVYGNVLGALAVLFVGVIRSSALWLTAGLTLLAASVFTAPATLSRARRRARRQRAAAARGRAG
jgi:hypothetical protein